MPAVMTMMTMPMAMMVMTGFSFWNIFFQGNNDFVQKLSQLLPLISREWGKNCFCILQVFSLMVFRCGAALFRHGNDAVSFIPIRPFSDDATVSFQLPEYLAERSGAHIEHLLQFTLVDGFFFLEDGEHMRLRMLGMSLAMMCASHQLDGVVKEHNQVFAGHG